MGKAPTPPQQVWHRRNLISKWLTNTKSCNFILKQQPDTYGQPPGEQKSSSSITSVLERLWNNLYLPRTGEDVGDGAFGWQLVSDLKLKTCVLSLSAALILFYLKKEKKRTYTSNGLYKYVHLNHTYTSNGLYKYVHFNM